MSRVNKKEERPVGKLSKKEVKIYYLYVILPRIVESEGGGRKDSEARTKAWKDYTELLCKDGCITENQYNSWTTPKFC